MRAFLAIVFSLFFFTFFPRSSLAALTFNDAVFPEIITSARALAMGNAFICRVDDSAAAFYNPAGLGTVRYPHFHLSNLHVEANKDWMDMTAGGNVLDAASDFPNGFSLIGRRELHTKLENRSKSAHSRFHFAPNFTTRYFSLGYLFSKRTKTAMGGDPGDAFEYADRTDHGPYAALNFSLFGGVVKFGVTGILLNRKELIGEVEENEQLETGDSVAKKGTAFIATSGFRLTLPIVFLPTIAVVYHNSFGQSFSGRAAGPPDTIESTLDLGFSVTPQIGKFVRVHIEANYKDVAQEYKGVAATRRLIAGMELDIARTIFFRVGYGDGFGSAGIGIRSKKLEFDLTSYAVDETTSSFRGREDRRFAMSMSTGF